MTEYGGDIFDQDGQRCVHILPTTLNATWDAGLWSDLNKQLGTLFDRYEAEAVSTEQLPTVIDAIRRYLADATHTDVDVRANLDEMIVYCASAASQGRGVSFGFS